MAVITSQTIPGASVYGINQVSYTVDGVAGRDYGTAVAPATLRQAVAFEAECNALSAMVRQRMKKLDELGEALSVIAGVMANMPAKRPKSSHTVEDEGLWLVKSTMENYGITIKDDKGNIKTLLEGNKAKIRRDNASLAQNEIRYAMDREDNDLQQDLITVQSAFSKRDNAFSTASQLVKKWHNSAKAIIANFGD